MSFGDFSSDALLSRHLGPCCVACDLGSNPSGLPSLATCKYTSTCPRMARGFHHSNCTFYFNNYKINFELIRMEDLTHE